MTIKNLFDKKVTLTDLEHLVYDQLKDSYTLEDAYCLHPMDIHYNTQIPMKKLRGVISSLTKKHVAYTQKWNGKDTWVFLYEKPEY